jgi:hypothetical protein
VTGNRVSDRADHILGVDALFNEAVFCTGHQDINTRNAGRLFGKSDNWDICAITDPPYGLNTLRIRQEKIEQDRVESVFAHMSEGFNKGRDPDDFDRPTRPVTDQVQEDSGIRLVVFHQQEA